MPKGRKHTQRERLLSGMIEAANRGGYAAASVSTVIANAGVSRPTFYDYFEDRDDCFLAAIGDVQQELLAQVAAALNAQPASEGAALLIGELVSYASANPERARFLMAESMAGGASALELRDRGVLEIAQALEQAQAGAADAEQLADLPGTVLVGAAYRILATRLRRGEVAISKLSEELGGWVGAFERPSAARRWSVLRPAAQPARSAHLPEVPIQQTPGVFPPGRPRLSEEEVAENHRMRILYAAARMAEEKGYTATTVADITKLSRVDGRVFYRLFADKQEAFTAVHELGFQQVMDVTAKAFFAGEQWPQRSWEGGRALTQLLQENPLVAHVGFVEAYAVGPRAVQRIEDSHTAFMFFLQEGLIYGAPDPPPSRVAMEATIAAIFEVIYLQARSDATKIAAMLGQIAHLWLTPFLGTEQSDEFIDAQLPRAQRRSSAKKP